MLTHADVCEHRTPTSRQQEHYCDEARKDTEDTTLVQIEEVERSIRALPFVTKLSPVGARNSHGHGYRVSLRCPSGEEYGEMSFL